MNGNLTPTQRVDRQIRRYYPSISKELHQDERDGLVQQTEPWVDASFAYELASTLEILQAEMEWMSKAMDREFENFKQMKSKLAACEALLKDSRHTSNVSPSSDSTTQQAHEGNSQPNS